jgi:FkbM family methyltransferase
MDLYGQDAELRVLGKLVTRLDRRTLIDVGAEQGALAAGILDAGVEQLHALEPHPENVEALRTRFSHDDRVTIHEYAISDSDGDAELHVSTHPDGRPLPFGHTLLERADTSDIVWGDRITVTRRSLQSLIDAGEIPSSVGILKVDTEGHDLAVVRGMGALEADIVMVEHWKDLPNGLGPCPWTTSEMVEALAERGFTHFAFIVHRADFVTLKWDDGELERGAMGNLMFVHDRVLPRLLPDLLECAGWLGERAVSVGQRYMRAAADRLAIVDELEQAGNDRLALVHELEEAAQARLQALETTTTQLRSKSAELDALRSKHPEDSAA